MEECLNDNDVIVLLDSSGSIGADNYKLGKVFVYDIARSFENSISSRFGLTIFSTSVLQIATLTNTLTPTDLNSAILNATYMSETTNTGQGIDDVVSQLLASGSVPKNLVVITDGLSNDPTATITAANAAITAGIRTFSVGVGAGANAAELLAIAGGNSSRTFTASDFDELTELVNPVNTVICQ